MDEGGRGETGKEREGSSGQSAEGMLRPQGEREKTLHTSVVFGNFAKSDFISQNILELPSFCPNAGLFISSVQTMLEMSVGLLLR